MENKVIEFVGMPGSGKTFWATSNQYPSSAFTYLEVSGRERFVLTFQFFISKPFLFCKLVYLLIKNSKKDLSLIKHKIFFLLFFACALEIKSKKLPNPLIDQGLLQVFLCMYDQAVSLERIHNDFELIRKELTMRTIVFVEASQNVRMKRIDSRKRMPRSNFGSTYVESFLAAVASNYPTIKSCIAETFPSKTINGEG